VVVADHVIAEVAFIDSDVVMLLTMIANNAIRDTLWSTFALS